jgi:AcrR family transcriptional regulator
MTGAERPLLHVDAIVAAATAVVDQRGPEALSLRGLAQDLGVTAPALYDHIRSKDDLFRLVAREGYRELAARWSGLPRQEATAWLRASSQAYVAFALERPGLFTVMFRYRPSFVAGPDEAEDHAATDIFQEALAMVERAVAAGDLAGDPVELALALWAAVHGAATVLALSPEMHDATWLVDLVVDGLLAGWKEPPT